MQNIIPTATAATLITSLLIGLALFVGRNALRTWSTKGVEHSFEKKLEAFKANISARTSRELAAHNAAASVQLLGAQKRLDAIDQLWRSVLRIKNRRHPPFAPLSFLLEDEYFESAADFRKDISYDSELAAFHKEYEEDGVEMLRPFLSPVLWQYYFIYRAFYGRLIYLDHKFLRGERDAFWARDNGIQQILTHAISKEAFAEVIKGPFQDPTQILNLLEYEILKEAWKLINGQAFGEESFKQAEYLSKMQIVKSESVSIKAAR